MKLTRLHWGLIIGAVVLILVIRWWLRRPEKTDQIKTEIKIVNGKPTVIKTTTGTTSPPVTLNSNPASFKSFQAVYAAESVPVYESDFMIGSPIKTVNIGNLIGYFTKVLPSGVVELSEGAPPMVLGKKLYVKKESIIYVK